MSVVSVVCVNCGSKIIAYPCPYCGYEDRLSIINKDFIPKAFCVDKKCYIDKFLNRLKDVASEFYNCLTEDDFVKGVENSGLIISDKDLFCNIYFRKSDNAKRISVSVRVDDEQRK